MTSKAQVGHLLFQSGVHPKVVSEWLKHAPRVLTLDTYSRVAPGMQEEATAQLRTNAARVETNR